MNFTKLDVRRTAIFAAHIAVTEGFAFSLQTDDEALGRVTWAGVIAPPLDSDGDPLGLCPPLHWTVAAQWVGIEAMDNQHRLDELREIVVASTIAHNAARWRRSGYRSLQWEQKVSGLEGTFMVLLPPQWNGMWGLVPR